MYITTTSNYFESVLVVESCPHTCRRLRQILTQCRVATNAINFVDGIAAAYVFLKQSTPPSLILVDITLTDHNDHELIHWIHNHLPNTVMMVMATCAHQDSIVTALRAGAVGYLLKERADDELIQALMTMAKGGASIDPFVAKRILQALHLLPSNTRHTALSNTCPSTLLSNREKIVLQWVSQGLTNKEISLHLSLSRHTIDTHIRNIYRKLAVSRRTQALKAAKQLGLLS